MLVLFNIACHTAAPTPDPITEFNENVVVTLQEDTVVLEELSEAALVSTVTAYQSFHADGEQLWFVDESLGESEGLATGQTFDSTVHDDTILLVLDGVLYSYSDELHEQAVNDLLQGGIDTIASSGTNLWMLGGGQLFRYTGSVLTQVRFDGVSHISSFAVSTDGVIWMAAPWLIAYDSNSGDVVESDASMMVRDLCLDSSSTLWVMGEDQLLAVRQDGERASFELGVALTDIRCSPQHTDVWFNSEVGAIHYRQGVFSSVDIPEGQWQDVDARGRLLVSVPQGIVRASTGRPVVTVGLDWNEQIFAKRDVELIPTDSDSVTELEAWIGDHRLEVDPDRWETSIDPVDFEVGQQSLRFVVVTDEGVDIDEHPLILGELPDVTWDSDVLPLSEEHCSECHYGATATRLELKSDWQWQIDAVIQEVSRDSMPLGGPYLTEEQIAVIRGWKAGGFQ